MWLIAATLGLAVTALRRADGAGLRWWLRGYGLHALLTATTGLVAVGLGGSLLWSALLMDAAATL